MARSGTHAMPPEVSSLISEDSSSSCPSSPAGLSGKRKLSALNSTLLGETYEFTSNTSDFDDVAGFIDFGPPPKKQLLRTRAIAVQVPGLAFPRSLYNDNVSSIANVDESDILDELLREEDAEEGVECDTDLNTFLAANLEEFNIYRRHRLTKNELQKTSRESPLANELVSLHEINERNSGFFFFDGLICFGNHRRYVSRVPFDILSIGRYEALEHTTVGNDIWIQSFEGRKRDVWYQLGKPSPEYKRYHKPFLWIADFAKHLVDYLHLHTVVYLDNFRMHFCGWLRNQYRHAENITRWREEYGRTDFRSALVAHANFLYCQATQVDTKHAKQPLWDEIDSRGLIAVPPQMEKAVNPEMTARVETGEQNNIQRKTTVTPFVNRCFADMPWARFLHSSISRTLEAPAFKDPTRGRRCDSRAATKARSDRTVFKRKTLQRPIKIGDVVAVESDEMGSWKTEDNDYYAYVQDVTVTTTGRSLSLLWFYRPGDTACKKMSYPFEKELFLSDHCNCGDATVYEYDVIYLPEVTFFGQPNSPSCDFFCRQQYVGAECAWRTLQKHHFQCQCKNPSPAINFDIGDTLLVKKTWGKGRYILEPVILTEHAPQDSGHGMKVRRLLRKGRDYGHTDAAPNELVYTDQFDIIPTSATERSCQIRFFTEEQKRQGQIPHPYNKRGLGDFFFITTQGRLGNLNCSIPEQTLQLLALSQPWPTTMRPGWLPEQGMAESRRLRGLDIFCGGGNFGRGLEEGGAVEFEWAVDYYSEAIHTYKANLHEGKKTKLFRGSVNHYLSQAMAGNGVGLVAQKGEVDVITSGNPCQGFSVVNPYRGVHDRGLLNESLVASAVSFIDYYRPRYALLENVLGIASDGKSHNVLSQVLCTIVGMGYQVKPFILDAWNFSSPQSRSRVFISCAAAGLEPLEEPPHTHSHPEQVMGSSLGKTANGLRISARYQAPTPFEYVTAEEALKDLPATDGRTSCISFPDHRMSVPLSTLDRIRLESVPRHPAGMSFVKAVERGYMPQAQIDNFGWHNSIRARNGSKCWQRVPRNALMPTVTTVPRPSDGAAGNCLHWDQHRLFTIMEVRRAQGFPDDEIIIGEKSAQYKIVGNSVARPVAFALGLSLRKAWLASSNQAKTTSLAWHETTTTSQVREDVEASDKCSPRQKMEQKPRWGGLRMGIVEANTQISLFCHKEPQKLITKSGRAGKEVMKVHRPHAMQTVVSPTNSITTKTSMPEAESNRNVQDTKVKTHAYARNIPLSPNSALIAQPKSPIYFQPRTEVNCRPRTPTTTSPSIQSASGRPSHTSAAPPLLGSSIAEIMKRHDEHSRVISNNMSPKRNSPLSTHSGRHNSWAMESPNTSSPTKNSRFNPRLNTFEVIESELSIRQTTTTIAGTAVTPIDQQLMAGKEPVQREPRLSEALKRIEQQ